MRWIVRIKKERKFQPPKSAAISQGEGTRRISQLLRQSCVESSPTKSNIIKLAQRLRSVKMNSET